MKLIFSILWIFVIIGATALPLCCEPKEDDHGEEESPSGASFKPGKGVIIKEETSKILGLEIADVTEELLPQVVKFDVQIFVESHRFADLNIDHTGCQFHGSGFLPPDKAALVKPKAPVKFQGSSDEILDGYVIAVQKPLARGEIEIIVGVTTADSNLKDGEFVSATISMPRNEPVTVIPSSALLRTVAGTYVYVVNGEAYLRTAVTVGGSANGKVEIMDGLYEGDQVVAKPVETLWIIELRATKGGGHSH